MTPEQAASLAGALGPGARCDVAVGPLTTYRVGGRAAVLYEASSPEDLAPVAQAVQETGVAVLVLGRGSNLLVCDAGFPGLVVTLGPGFAELAIEGTRVIAGAGVDLPVLARRSAAAGLTGLEWMVGVPGSLGGAVRMNAGGHGSDMAASLQRWCFVDLTGGQDGERDVTALSYEYRSSAVGPAHVVVWAAFDLEPGDRQESDATISEIVRWRRASQPGGQNAGSVFTNPEGDSAGRLVDAAGLKGRRLGSAQVSTKHANFIQADPNGSADDVWRLMLEVIDVVEGRFGVRLQPEVRLVGFDHR
jgi:UDP-N-acetylmuramate dehydrogenase